MSDTIIVALIASIPPTLVALASVFVSLYNGRKIREVHQTINSGLSRQLDTAQKLGNAEGRAEQIKEDAP